MFPPPMPTDETARLRTLHALGVLDTPREERFDRLARVASAALRTPFAAIGLVDADRVWFKASEGFDESSVPRAASICAHAIGSDETLVIEDLSVDPRFATGPLVAEGLRFYAGHPLVAPDGHRLGVLCVFGTEPRTVGEAERAILADLAAAAVDKLFDRELNRALRAAEAAARTRAAFLAAMSHELRTPLNAVIGYAEIVREDAEARGADELVPDLTKIRGAGRDLLGLIDDLLEAAERARA